MSQHDAPRLSNESLAKFMERIHFFAERGLNYFATSSPGSTYYVEQRMREILAAKLEDDPHLQEYFITLTTPAAMDETMRERLDFTALAQRSEARDEVLLAFARRYPALFMNTYDEGEVLAYLRQRLAEQRASEKLRHEQATIENGLAQVRAQHEQVRRAVPNDELHYLATIIQRAALGRFKLKHVWNGVEYTCLPVLHETARRIGISVSDLVRAYRYSDVLAFLRGGTRLSDEEVAARRRCYVFHYFDGRLEYITGEIGERYAERLVGVGSATDDSDTSELTGQPASLGTVRGKARVVFVDDLRQFVRDCEDFQKGEILVTTMTSPIMIPLMFRNNQKVTPW